MIVFFIPIDDTIMIGPLIMIGIAIDIVNRASLWLTNTSPHMTMIACYFWFLIYLTKKGNCGSCITAANGEFMRQFLAIPGTCNAYMLK